MLVDVEDAPSVITATGLLFEYGPPLLQTAGGTAAGFSAASVAVPLTLALATIPGPGVLLRPEGKINFTVDWGGPRPPDPTSVSPKFAYDPVSYERLRQMYPNAPVYYSGTKEEAQGHTILLWASDEGRSEPRASSTNLPWKSPPVEEVTPQKTIKGSSKPGPGEALVGSSPDQMRRAAEKKIAADPNHELRFLLDASGKFKKQAGLKHHQLIDRPDLVQMGHIMSKKRGGMRIMLQGAWENQLNNVSIENRHKEGAVIDQPAINIGGIAVDLKTAKTWEQMDFLKLGTVKAAPRIEP